jgi:hypothetical protein
MAKVLIYTFALDDGNENEISTWEHTALGFSLKKAPSITFGDSNFSSLLRTRELVTQQKIVDISGLIV